MGSKFRACSLFANIGKTPPYWAWILACDKVILAIIFSSSIKAKAVSSQLVSIPKIIADFFSIFFDIIFIAFDLSIGENPDVRVRHFVADDFRENPIGFKSFLLSDGDFFYRLKIFAGIWNIPNPAIMFFGNNLGVSGALRMNVQKRQKISVFINNFRRNFLLGDFTKYAISFGVSHWKSISC